MTQCIGRCIDKCTTSTSVPHAAPVYFTDDDSSPAKFTVHINVTFPGDGTTGQTIVDRISAVSMTSIRGQLGVNMLFGPISMHNQVPSVVWLMHLGRGKPRSNTANLVCCLMVPLQVGCDMLLPSYVLQPSLVLTWVRLSCTVARVAGKGTDRAAEDRQATLEATKLLCYQH